MWRAQAQNEEARLKVEKHVKCQGTARIRLSSLHFPWNKLRKLDPKNVDRLKSNFRKDCRRLEVRNHIPALIGQQQLDAALQVSGISAGTLRSQPASGYPELVFPAGYQLDCLHGRHRIQAGKEALSPGDQWWTVDLYLADIDRSLRTCLIEEYSNEEKPSDGEIYCRIRQYHFQRNLIFEWRWWNRLTPHGERCLKQLLRHDELTAVFDALSDFPGVIEEMSILTLHTMLAMKCHEETLHYLRHIEYFWETLLLRDPGAKQYVDHATVKALELRAPGVSTLDANILRGQILGGEIFSAFSEQDRRGIWTRLQEFDGLIPSLFSFFKDVNYLKALVNGITRLVRLSPRDTVSSALERAFSDAGHRADRAVIQVSETDFAFCPASLSDQVDLGRRQLYAYAMRHYLKMPREPKVTKKKELVAKPRTQADEGALRGFADLADRLGFQSPEITALKQYPHSRVANAGSKKSKPLLVMDGAGVKIKQRCGLPSIEDHVEDQESLFIDHLHTAGEEQGEGVTSFFVRKSVYCAFFGRSLLPVLESTSPTQSQSGDQSQGTSSRIEGDTEILQDETEQREDARIMQERQEQARQEEVRQEQARQEEARREEARREEARREEARQEEARREEARQEEARKDRERLQRLEQKKLQQERLEKEQKEKGKRQREDIEEPERREHQSLEDERKLEDQQRVQHEELLESEALDQEEIIDNTKVYVHWKVHERGKWKDTSVLPIDPLDPSPIERTAKGYVREKIRLFNTDLRMMTPRDCYQAVVTDGTYTILLIPESELDINNDLLLSAMKVRIEALSYRGGAPKRVATEDISQRHHVRKKHRGTVGI